MKKHPSLENEMITTKRDEQFMSRKATPDDIVHVLDKSNDTAALEIALYNRSSIIVSQVITSRDEKLAVKAAINYLENILKDWDQQSN